jgi:hypothetical protein
MMDFETLTLDEIETIELLTGISIDKIAEDDQPKGKNLKAIIFVMKRRSDPEFTIADAGKLSFKDAIALFDGNEKKEG